ncbi:hypothetical protein Ancab_010608 [Ancistrocladus abbreviatus]
MSAVKKKAVSNVPKINGDRHGLSSLCGLGQGHQQATAELDPRTIRSPGVSIAGHVSSSKKHQEDALMEDSPAQVLKREETVTGDFSAAMGTEPWSANHVLTSPTDIRRPTSPQPKLGGPSKSILGSVHRIRPKKPHTSPAISGESKQTHSGEHVELETTGDSFQDSNVENMIRIFLKKAILGHKGGDLGNGEVAGGALNGRQTYRNSLHCGVSTKGLLALGITDFLKS